MKYSFVPSIIEMQYAHFWNITFYAILLGIYISNAKEIDIYGLDFWEGDYLNKLSTDIQKAIPERKDMYNKFYELIDKHKFISFTMYTKSSKVRERDNLTIVRV